MVPLNKGIILSAFFDNSSKMPVAGTVIKLPVVSSI